MTNRRPFDADGNPPMEGQMDLYEVIDERIAAKDSAKAESDEERIHRKAQERLDRPMTAAEIVAARLKEQQ
jgi:hypothetical protein